MQTNVDSRVTGNVTLASDDNRQKTAPKVRKGTHYEGKTENIRYSYRNYDVGFNEKQCL